MQGLSLLYKGFSAMSINQSKNHKVLVPNASDPPPNTSSSSVQFEMVVQKQAEEAQSLLAAIVASSDDAIISKTLDGVITSWNNAATTFFGYSAQEAIGQHIYLIIPLHL